MQREIKHYILTRFNCKMGGAKKLDITGRTKEGIIWLDRRLELFHKYYLPSINQQTCKNFKIVFLSNSESPQSLIDELSNHGQVIFSDFTQWFKEQPLPIITTRLDSDDCLHKDFVEKVQRKCGAGGVEQLVDIKPAYLIVKGGATGFISSRRPSQFITSYSTTHERFCCSTEHPKMREFFRQYEVLDFFGALHIIHGTNLADKESRFQKNRRHINLEDYGIKL